MTRLAYFYFASTGYEGIEMWMLPNIAYQGSGEGRLTHFKVAELTNTSIRSLILAVLLLLVSTFVGIFFMQMFWSIAPMPSAIHPATEIFWPINAAMNGLWIKGQFYGLFKPLWMLYAFIGATAVYLFTLPSLQPS